MKKRIGKVTALERNEIQTLFERKNGLKELAKVITGDNDEENLLYERIVKDMGSTSARFQEWWDRTGEKYHWEKTDDGRWEIDFNTGEIYLTDKK